MLQRVCEKCGTSIYSVVKKIKLLLERYYEPAIVKHIMDVYYSKRSKYFHEGDRDTEEHYVGICWSQIDEEDTRSILAPHSMIDINLFDWVDFVIKKRI